MRPFFWPTKIRPSGANCTTVGFVSPSITMLSWNPAAGVDAVAVEVASTRTAGNSAVTANATIIRRGLETAPFEHNPLARMIRSAPARFHLMLCHVNQARDGAVPRTEQRTADDVAEVVH